jgi:hypothetical protein
MYSEVHISVNCQEIVSIMHHLKDNFVQNQLIPTAHFQYLPPQEPPSARAGHKW